MSKIKIILLLSFITCISLSCSYNNKNPKRVYMPDMYYSEAYEPYNKISMKNNNIIYPLIKSSGSASFYPVSGTISRNYNILDKKTKNTHTIRGKKMYMINCAICHGINGDGEGFLVTKEKILGVPNYKNTSISNMNDVYKVIKYGKNNMGSYSSQLSELDILEVCKYVLYLKNK